MSFEARARFVSKALRIGVYGGTFDPVHKVHIRMGRAAMAHAQLDRVFFVVSASPPHKGEAVCAGARDRYDMLCAALAGEPRMKASRIEMDRHGPSYTVDTLGQFAAQYPGSDLFFVVGRDSLLDLPGWRDPEGIMAKARLLVVSRPGIPKDIPQTLEGRFEWLPFEESSLSSTEIRGRIAAGEDVVEYTGAEVLRVIRERGLYGV